MSNAELKQYFLKHRGDQAAFQAAIRQELEVVRNSGSQQLTLRWSGPKGALWGLTLSL